MLYLHLWPIPLRTCNFFVLWAPLLLAASCIPLLLEALRTSSLKVGTCWRHPDFDPTGLAAEIIDVVLDVLVDLPTSLNEGLLNVLRGLRRSLPEHQAMLTGKLSTLFVGDLPALEVALVANKHDDHVGVGVLPGLFKPACEVVEGITSGDIIDQQR